jgi:uncharacterized phage-like protein YoqJ
MKLAFTGHRFKDLPEDDDTLNWLEDNLYGVMLEIKSTVPTPKIISGMAEGVDQIAAMVAIDLFIPLIAARPYGDHAAGDKDTYKYILEHADQVVVVSPGAYAVWKLHARNEWMVDNADMLCAVWNPEKESGGTYACLQYALKKSTIPILHIDPFAKSKKWIR